MSQITVWKCDRTGKLFENKSKYQTHLRKLAKERIVRRQIQIKEAEADTWWAAAYEREMSIDDWRQFVINNQNRFWAEAAANSSYNWNYVGKSHGRRKNSVVCPVPELLEFTIFNLSWSPCVSNTHSRPHNGVTNWGGQETVDGKPAPRGYPGWHGQVEWIVRWPKEWDGVYIGSDLFLGSRCRAHTGGGGGGGMNYNKQYECFVQRFGYEFRLYAADWPGMVRHHEKQTMWSLLGGRKRERELLDIILEDAIIKT